MLALDARNLNVDVLNDIRWWDNYPNFIRDRFISEAIRVLTPKRANNKLLVADLWCWEIPVSSSIYPLDGYDTKIMWIDIQKLDEQRESPNNVRFFQWDIQDSSLVLWSKDEFFKENEIIWERKFDVVFLSNILNYIKRPYEYLSEGSISGNVSNLLDSIVAKILAEDGILVIQNGSKLFRYRQLREDQVNDYFSQAFEEVIHKSFKDLFYLWTASIHPPNFLIRTVAEFFRKKSDYTPLLQFSSYDELAQIRASHRCFSAYNVRVMKHKDIR